MITRLFRRSRPGRGWAIKVTTPDGTLVDVDTEMLGALWKFGRRSTDGYVDLLEMPGVHLWVKPAGWTEPDRATQLDGTAAIRQDLRWS